MLRNGGSINGDIPKWMVYNGKSIYKWMLWRYPYFRKPPNGEFFCHNFNQPT
jgi:hypothetical protein